MAENPTRRYVKRIVIVHPDGRALINVNGEARTIDWQGPVPSSPHVINATLLLVEGLPVAASPESTTPRTPRRLVPR